MSICLAAALLQAIAYALRALDKYFVPNPLEFCWLLSILFVVLFIA
jgi:hypothetical protein